MDRNSMYIGPMIQYLFIHISSIVFLFLCTVLCLQHASYTFDLHESLPIQNLAVCDFESILCKTKLNLMPEPPFKNVINFLRKSN